MKALMLLGCVLAFGFATAVRGSESVAALKKRCLGGDGEACFQVGGRYEYGNGVQQNWQEAANYYKKGCSLKFGIACQHMASLYKRGEGVPKDVSESIRFSHLAADVHRKSCSEGKDVDCFTLGLLYVEGSGIQRQCPEGMKLLRAACEKQTGLACSVLGNMYVEAVEGSCVKQRDLTVARSYFKKGCEIGTGYWGCLELGNVYEKGLGVLPDKVEAIRFYLRGCMGSPQSDSCYNVERLCKEQKYPGCP